MKNAHLEDEGNGLILLNKAFFEELHKATSFSNREATAVDVLSLDKLLSIVAEITEKHAFAIINLESAKKPQKKRSEAQKVGKFRYLNRKIDRLDSKVNELRGYTKNIMLSLSPFLDIEKDTLTKIVCSDEIDEELLSYVSTHNAVGITPSEAIVSDELKDYGLKPYQITRRLQRMNRKLQSTLNRHLVLSTNRRWKLSRYAYKRIIEQTEEGLSLDEQES